MVNTIVLAIRYVLDFWGLFHLFCAKERWKHLRLILTAAVVMLRLILYNSQEQLIMLGLLISAFYQLAVFPLISKVNYARFVFVYVLFTVVFGTITYLLEAFIIPTDTVLVIEGNAWNQTFTLLLYAIFLKYCIKSFQDKQWTGILQYSLFVIPLTLSAAIFSFVEMFQTLMALNLQDENAPFYFSFWIAALCLFILLGFWIYYLWQKRHMKKVFSLWQQELDVREEQLSQQTVSLSKLRHDELNLISSLTYLAKSSQIQEAIDLADEVLTHTKASLTDI